MSVSNAIKWSFLSELAAKIVQPLVFVILARLLTPEDFGVVAAAMMVISFSQIFWEAGMGKAVIQYQGDSYIAANTAFWINNFLGIFVAGLLIAISNLVADNIFHDLRVGSVLQVMSIQIFLAALASVHTALLQKEMQFKRLFWVRFVTVCLPGLVSIPLALNGMGYWAIVIGSLTGQVMQVVMLWKICEWRPSMIINRRVGIKLIEFGVWVAFSGLLSWFYSWADSLIVGMHLGAKELGIYRTGNQFIIMIYALIFNPIQPVLYSYFSGIQYDLDRIEKLLLKVINIIAFVAIPIGFILNIFAQAISSNIFGQNWDGIELVIKVLAVTHGFTWLVGLNGEVYRATGRPSLETYIMLACIIIYCIGYFVSIQLGFEIFLWTRFGLAISTLFIHLYALINFLKLRVNMVIKYPLKITLAMLPSLLLEKVISLSEIDINPMVTSFICTSYILLILYVIERQGIIHQIYLAFNQTRKKIFNCP